MTEIECSCGRPTAGAWLCERCQGTLAIAIANIAAYFGDLETVQTKRTRYGGLATKGSVGKAQPLPVDHRFVNGAPRLDVFGGVGGPASSPGTQVKWDTWNTIHTWCRTVMEEQPQTSGPTCHLACLHTSCAAIKRRRWPKNTIQSMCLYLDRQFRWIVREQWAPVILDELLDIERRLARLVDRPADRWYAGKCSAITLEHGAAGCPTELYANVDKGFIVCQTCESRHDVGERRDYLLREAKDYLVTATEAASALLAWTDYDGSEAKLVDRIRKWRDRERLQVADVTSLYGKDRHLYRLGDIQDLMIASAQHAQHRTLNEAR